MNYNFFSPNRNHLTEFFENDQKSPLVLYPGTDDKIRAMFTEIDTVYEQAVLNATPPGGYVRKCFLNYNYVTHQCCRLVDRDFLTVHFPLLKSQEKLEEHDRIWKEICAILKWEFLPTVEE